MAVRKSNYEDFLYGEIHSSNLLSGFLIGHLVIEHLLERIIANYDAKLINHFEGLTHNRKINLLESLEIIPSPIAGCLQNINKIRNKFAHELGYKPNKGELLTLIGKCRSSFSDLTDGLAQLETALKVSADLQESEERCGCGLADIFIQVVYDLEMYAEIDE